MTKRQQKAADRQRFIEERLKALDEQRSATNARVASVLRALTAEDIIKLRDDGVDRALCDKALAGDVDSLHEIAEQLDRAQQFVGGELALEGAAPAVPTKIYQA